MSEDKFGTPSIQALREFYPGLVAEGNGRTFDVSDPKWGHPESLDGWEPNLMYGASLFPLYDPFIPRDQKQLIGTPGDQFTYGAWTATEHTCNCEQFMVPGCPEEPETEAELFVLTPKGLEDKKTPVLFFVPAGAFVSWGAASHPVDAWAEKFRCRVVLVRYRLAWQAAYPAAVNDLHAGFQWVFDHADEMHFDTDNILIAGMSTGAHLACSLPFRLKRYGFPTARGVVAMCPQTDDRFDGTEMLYAGVWDSFAQHDSMMSWLGRNFASGAVGPEAVANHATVSECVGYPPLFIHTSELDPDADFNREFYGKVKAAHSFCEYHSWGGALHTSCTWWGLMVGMDEGSFSEETKFVTALVEKNMADCLQYDLRRPWVEEA